MCNVMCMQLDRIIIDSLYTLLVIVYFLKTFSTQMIYLTQLKVINLYCPVNLKNFYVTYCEFELTYSYYQKEFHVPSEKKQYSYDILYYIVKFYLLFALKFAHLLYRTQWVLFDASYVC